MNKDSLNNNAITVIISIISDNKVCIPKFTIGTSEVINNDSYKINQVTLTATDNDIKGDVKTNHIQKTHTDDTCTLRTVPQDNQTQ